MSNPWEIDRQCFPTTGSPAEQLKFITRYALLAPSTHNTQPWKFIIQHDELKLYADRSRQLTEADPSGRELVMSCGAALGQLRVALQHFGLDPEVSLLPDSNEPDWLARVKISPSNVYDDQLLPLFDGIFKRHTSRTAFASTAVPQQVIDKITDLAGRLGVGVAFISDADQQQQLARLVAEGDQLLFKNKNFRLELRRWLRGKDSNTKDGIASRSLGLPAWLAPLAAYIIQKLDVGDMVARNDAQLVLTAPLLVILHTPENQPMDWLLAGQALDWMLLFAAANRINASFFSQPLEAPGLLSRFNEIVQISGQPQLFFRLGYAVDAKPSARRDVDTVVSME